MQLAVSLECLHRPFYCKHIIKRSHEFCWLCHTLALSRRSCERSAFLRRRPFLLVEGSLVARAPPPALPGVPLVCSAGGVLRAASRALTSGHCLPFPSSASLQCLPRSFLCRPPPPRMMSRLLSLMGVAALAVGTSSVVAQPPVLGNQVYIKGQSALLPAESQRRARAKRESREAPHDRRPWSGVDAGLTPPVCHASAPSLSLLRYHVAPVRRSVVPRDGDRRWSVNRCRSQRLWLSRSLVLPAGPALVVLCLQASSSRSSPT